MLRTEFQVLHSSSRNSQELDCLARAIYWEARGEGEEGMAAVGHVIMNRKAAAQFPNSICRVIYQNGQFSWTSDRRLRNRPLPQNRLALQALRVAYSIYHGSPDITNGALYFHARRVRPSWRQSFEEVAENFGAGNHIFYRDR